MALGKKVLTAPATKTVAAVVGRRRSSRVFLRTTGGGLSIVTIGYGCYKAKYDPPHLVWDLDNTILCSVSPIIPTTNSTTSSSSSTTEEASSSSTTTSNIDQYLDSFDQIDDDFPYEGDKSNTRTYFRPGARTALWICNFFAIQHVYTTAQSTYTTNILNEIDADRTIFHTVIDRDISPKSVKHGKDLTLIANEVIKKASSSNNSNDDNDDDESRSRMLLKRLILFDDRVKNFTPQNGANGIHVYPFQLLVVRKKKDIEDSISDDDGDNEKPRLKKFHTGTYLREGLEVSRLVGISLLCLFASDTREVLSYFQSKDHKKYFSPTSSTTKSSSSAT